MYEKLIEMSKKGDYTTASLLDYLYYRNNYKFIGTDLSRQTNTTIPQKTNFLEELEESNGEVMFFIAEKQKSNYSKLSFDSLIVSE